MPAAPAVREPALPTSSPIEVGGLALREHLDYVAIARSSASILAEMASSTAYSASSTVA